MKAFLPVSIMLLFFLKADAQRNKKQEHFKSDTIAIGTTFQLNWKLSLWWYYSEEEKIYELDPYYDSLAAFINKYPLNIFAIESHTDCRADSLYNRGLSQRRADTTRAMLVRHGADGSRLFAFGKGEDEL